MGFYVRKSLRAGPFRFNLSKSGVGVSAGVPGFRVGTGPRGNYVHVGAHGVYYRASLGGRSPGAAPRQPAARPAPAWTPQMSANQQVVMTDITGATALELAPASADDLVSQLNEAAAVRAWWPVPLIIPVVGWAVAYWLRLKQKARRSVVVFYEVEASSGQWFEQLVESWGGLAHSAGLWRMTSQGALNTTHLRKVNAGASTLINRVSAVVSLHAPAVLVTNIAVPSVQAGRQSLHFLPDRLLVQAGRRFSEVSYAQLTVHCAQTRYIEDGRLPRDATRVGTTWKYANVSGGPDRRYNNNRQLPILGYAEVELTTASGLHWTLQCSNLAAAKGAAAVLSQAKAPALAREPASPPPTQLLSDAERDRACDRLRAAYLDGRLTEPEYDERSGQALKARRQSELDACLEGIPAAPAAPPRGVSPSPPPVAVQPHASPTTPPSVGMPAGWFQRAGAWLLDSVICFAAYFVALMVIFGVLAAVTGKSSPNPPGWLSALMVVLAPAIFLAYQVLLLSRSGAGNGQTLGKRWLGLRVISGSGRPVSAAEAWRREGLVIGLVGVLTGGLFLLVDFLWPLGESSHRALHDRWSGTSVVNAR
jgi:uncharacterized RDD family membrane protein YckC